MEFFERIELLKSSFSEYFRIGLQDYEFMLARYDMGHFYKKHLDRFDHRSNRVLSVVLYLNHDWQAGFGGELVVYQDNMPILIPPIAGRLVLMRSDVVWHEVLPSNFVRKSLTGWLTKLPLGLGNLHNS